MDCPNDHGPMQLVDVTRELSFRGKQVKVRVKHYACPVCALEADDLRLATENQNALSEAYRASVKLLTGEQMIKGRKKRGWTQEDLARAANVGVASVKRWETGQVQTKVMDDVLRRALSGETMCGDPYTGNRPLSLARIKLVLTRFSLLLGRRLLKSAPDKMLYAAKYLWYADMVAFREIGQGMTGATYAALPHGPQLNNYNDLVDLIRKADEDKAESLTDHEERILAQIARTFLSEQSIYRAVHKEQAYLSKNNGELIPYTDAGSITAM
jgi:putative zinc finger/helix-turn-helix YgiT family protein